MNPRYWSLQEVPVEKKNKIIPRQKSELLKLVEMGDKEISEGRGYSLEGVMKAADDLLKDDES